MFNKNTQAKAKLTLNKKLGLFRLLATFTAENDPKYITQRSAQYVSGDFELDELATQLRYASAALNTNDIVLVN